MEKAVVPTTEDTLIITDSVLISSNLTYPTAVVIIVKGGDIIFTTGKLRLPENSKIILDSGRITTLGGGNSDKIYINSENVWSGNDGDLDGNYVIEEIGIALPVRWGNVSARSSHNVIYVNFIVYAQINNDYFEVQSSKNLEEWKTDEILIGAGNSSSPMYYWCDFFTEYKGQVYIRIKQVDYDGKFDYSKIISVEVKPIETSDLLYYIDVVGKTYKTQPNGLSIAVYKNNIRAKVFK